ncbi:MAG: glycosyltransferase family 9 protein [Bacteroidota bacterium]|nr:glycosyltransferase family 9 protein [Bacteroidota bacterium]
MKYLVKLQNLIVYFISILLLLILKLYPAKILKNTLMVIRLDSIGDYILFRNFLEVLKKSEKFKNYSITLCGNIVYRDIAEGLDTEFIDRFIWINRKKFYSNPIYKFKILKQVKETGSETIINPTYTREILYGDMLAKAAIAPIKIGSSGAVDKHLKWKLGLFGKSIYNRVIPAVNENLFEFFRNIEFFEGVLEERIEINTPSIIIKKTDLKLPFDRYAVAFIGAQDIDRRWNVNYFAEICNYIVKKYKLPVVIAGGDCERKDADKIISISGSDKVLDYTGKTSLIELIHLIAKAKLLIANETSAIHFAAAVKTPFVCINRGKHLGRFSPYPEKVYNKGLYVYPKIIKENFEEFINNDTFRYDSELNIDQIGPEEVKKAIDNFLPDK